MSIVIDNKKITGFNINNKEVIKIQDANNLNIIWKKVVQPDYGSVTYPRNGSGIPSGWTEVKS